MINDWLFKPANYVSVDELKKSLKGIFDIELSDEKVGAYINEATEKIARYENETLTEYFKRLRK